MPWRRRRVCRRRRREPPAYRPCRPVRRMCCREPRRDRGDPRVAPPAFAAVAAARRRGGRVPPRRPEESVSAARPGSGTASASRSATPTPSGALRGEPPHHWDEDGTGVPGSLTPAVLPPGSGADQTTDKGRNRCTGVPGRRSLAVQPLKTGEGTSRLPPSRRRRRNFSRSTSRMVSEAGIFVFLPFLN